MNIKYFYGKNCRTNFGKNYSTKWSDFIKMFENPIVQKIEYSELQKLLKEKNNLQNIPIKNRTEEEKKQLKLLQEKITGFKNVHYIIGGHFKENTRSNGDDKLLYRNLIALDIDNCTMKIWEKLKVFDNIEYLLHTSFSHSQENPKLRIFFPVDNNIYNKHNYVNIVTNIITENGFSLQTKKNHYGEVDPASTKFNQLMFLPNTPENGKYIFKHNKGEILDITKYEKKENTVFDIPEKNNINTDKIQSPYEMKDSSTIKKFCMKFNIHECIKNFLSDIYIDRKNDRYTFAGGSSKHGAVVYPDNKGNQAVYIYSNHGTDELNNYHCHNSFDMIKFHKFNNNMYDTLEYVKKILNNNPQPVDKNVDNLDLKKVKWNPDYTFVKYLDPCGENNAKKIQRMSEYFQEFPDKNGPAIKNIIPLPIEQNIICLLDHYNYLVKYNVIKMDYEVFHNNKYIDVLENIKSHIDNLCIIQDIKIPDKRLMANLTLIGRKNKYNPWEDYLKKSHKYYLKNSDKDIFKKLAETLKSNDEWKNKFIGKFLLQMIYVGCSKDNDMIASDYILVLKGPQHIGKTTWLKNLLPNNLKHDYFLEGRSLDLNNKDSIMETVSNILLEMGEIATTFKKSDQEAMKNFITASRDKFRLPYGSAAITVKRRCCLAATTNDNEYLRDLTGTRRYLTINCDNFDRETKIDIDMLWGYLYDLYLKKVSYKFDIDEIKKINEINSQYINKPEKLLIIEDIWNLNPNEKDGQWKTAGEIFAELPPQFVLNKYSLGKELKKTSVKFDYNKSLKQYKFFVSKKNNEIEPLPDNDFDIEPF
jgi:putative DNA primase/helicase